MISKEFIFESFAKSIHDYLESIDIDENKREKIYIISKKLFRDSVDKLIPLLKIESFLRHDLSDLKSDLKDKIIFKISREIYSRSKRIHSLEDNKKNNPSSNPMSDWLPVLTGFALLIFLVNKNKQITNLKQTSVVVGVRG